MSNTIEFLGKKIYTERKVDELFRVNFTSAQRYPDAFKAWLRFEPILRNGVEGNWWFDNIAEYTVAPKKRNKIKIDCDTIPEDNISVAKWCGMLSVMVWDSYSNEEFAVDIKDVQAFKDAIDEVMAS